MTERIYMNRNWEFTEQFTEEFLQRRETEDNVELVQLPHTVKETPFHYFDESIYQMNAGYRKVFLAPGEWKDRKVQLTFEGVAHEAQVYLNGNLVALHRCGYTAFTITLDPYLYYGEENVLVVCVDSRENMNIPPFGYVVDYMTYGGIYRDVYLTLEDGLYAKDIYVRTNYAPHADGSRDLLVEMFLDHAPENETVVHSIYPWQDPAAEKVIGKQKVTQQKLHFEYQIKDVQAWDVEDPNLYVLVTRICDGDTVISQKEVRFGFRQMEFKADGFYLNGKKIKIFGVNRHQSFPYVGYAMPDSMQKADAEILKNELSLNAVRTSHYPQSHAFLDRCDELGLLVFTEIPGWQHIGDEQWKEQAKQNTKEMVLQYRNHPSIFLWGVRINESADDDAFYKETNRIAHCYDPDRATGGVRCIEQSHLYEDVYTYNDFIHDGKARGAKPKKKVTSNMDKAYLVSEYCGHMYPTKSFDWEEHRVEQLMRHATILDDIRGQEDIAGSFAWCMFDYNTHKDFGSGDRICYHGIMDMFRNKKLAAYLYESQGEEQDVLEITSSMDIGEHPGCNRGKIYVVTNADSVKMYKNGRFVAEFFHKDSPYQHLKHGPIFLNDYIGEELKQENFRPGQEAAVKQILNEVAITGMGKLSKKSMLQALKAVIGYRMRFSDAVELYNRYIGDWGGSVTTYQFEAIRDGKVVKTQQRGPMQQMRLWAKADHSFLKETKTYDVAAIRIQAQDENGNVLPFANEVVTFETEGPVEVIGPKTVSLQGGMFGTYIRTRQVERKENAVLRICSEQMGTVELRFEVCKEMCKEIL